VQNGSFLQENLQKKFLVFKKYIHESGIEMFPLLFLHIVHNLGYRPGSFVYPFGEQGIQNVREAGIINISSVSKHPKCI